MDKKVKNVLELSRYKVGQTVYWTVLRDSNYYPPIEEEWMERYHPKVLYERGPYKSLWSSKAMLPKLQHQDFTGIVSLLSTDFIIEEFIINEVVRSSDTGEYFYSNEDDEWMPESHLFDTNAAARKERNRILRLISKWSARQAT